MSYDTDTRASIVRGSDKTREAAKYQMNQTNIDTETVRCIKSYVMVSCIHNQQNTYLFYLKATENESMLYRVSQITCTKFCLKKTTHSCSEDDDLVSKHITKLAIF